MYTIVNVFTLNLSCQPSINCVCISYWMGYDS